MSLGLTKPQELFLGVLVDPVTEILLRFTSLPSTIRTCDLRLSVSPTIEKQPNNWAIVILSVSGALTAYQYRITKTEKLTLKYG